jgi:hypothetical protein
MRKYIQPTPEGKGVNYRPALIFLAVVFLFACYFAWNLLQSKTSPEGTPFLNVFKIFYLLAFSIFAGIVIVAFFFVLKISKGGEVVYVGIVTGKEKNADTIQVGRGGLLGLYNLVLDNEKKFINVKSEFYVQVEIGDTVEVHTTRFGDEILYIVKQ